jgi:hypothetical protein
VILQRGAHHFQERIRQLDEQSRLVRSFAPTAVLGILQTRAYASVVFTQRMTPQQAAPSLESRMVRHHMLDDPTRQWVLLQTEGALRWNLGGPAVMVEQIERIAVAIDRPNVRLGIIPWRRRLGSCHCTDSISMTTAQSWSVPDPAQRSWASTICPTTKNCSAS